MKQKIYFLLICLFSFSVLWGQQKMTITGTITDENNNPLIGANIVVSDLNIGATSDINGKYTIEIPQAYLTGAQSRIAVSYIGFKKKTETFVLRSGTLELDFKLEEDVFRSEEVVVTGIASKTSKDVAEVAVARINAEELTGVTGYQSMSQLVTGKISGVQLTPSSGNTGAGFRFFMRSGGGLNGDEQPVIYVDGVRIDGNEIVGYGVGGQGMSMLANLNPDEIESIDVLKGPAGAAMYGTSGSNGVVLIKTKSGKFKPTAEGTGFAIDYKYLTGFNSQSFTYSEADFISAKDANAIFRDGTIREHSLSGTGGYNFLRYFLSFNNRYEEGILENNYLDRTALRANLNAYPSNKVSLRINTNYILNELSRPNNDNNIYGYLGNTLLRPKSYVFTDSASVAGIKDLNKNNQFIGSAGITYTPIKNLEANFNIGLDNSDWRQDLTFPYDLNYSFAPDGDRAIWSRNNRQFTYDFNAQYKYSFLENLELTSIVGAQLFDRTLRTAFFRVRDFNTELITNIGAGENVIGRDETKLHERSAGIFTEHSAAYKNQYYLTLALRNDYASSIGSKAPNILYPKASFAIRMDKYDFMGNLFDMLKFRVAYGESGQLPGSIDAIPLLWRAEAGAYGAGAVLSAIGNEELEPERIKEFEVGVDFELFNNLSVEATYYQQFAENSIINFQNSPSTGKIASAVPFNIGALESKGFESLVQYTPIRSNDYRLDLSVIYNYQKNEVTDLGGAQPIFDGFDVNVVKEGLPKHEFFTQKVLGAKFNADGTYAGVLATEEREALGNPIPTHSGSFTINFTFLKNFKLYALADWTKDQKIFNNTKLFSVIFQNNPDYVLYRKQLGIVTTDPTVTPLTPGTAEYNDVAEKYARLNSNYDSNFIEDADFLKIREVSLSYSFKDLLPFIYANSYINDLVIGFSARNIFTTTKYSGADVEVNFNGSRSLSRGQDFLTLQNPKVYNFFVRLGI